MKLNPFNRLLLCLALGASCFLPTARLKAQEETEGLTEKPEKVEKKLKESHEGNRVGVDPAEPGEGGPRVKVKDKLLYKKEAKAGTKVAFLGVVLGPVEESLGSQLGLPDGVGVLVRAVLDDSPAAKAGVMQHDVLHYFNDQILVNEPQLQTLVLQAGIGAEVKLTVFRKGKSEVVHVKLGDIVARAQTPDEREGPAIFRQYHPGAPIEYPAGLRWAAQARNTEVYEREVRELQERLQKLHGNAEEMRKEVERFTARLHDVARREAGKKKGVLYHQDKADGVEPKVRVQIMNDGEGANSAVASAISGAVGKDGTTYITHNNVTVTKWKDEQGSGELKVENGRKNLTVKDAGGKEVFSGPIDTPEQLQKLSPEVREQVERIEKGVKVEVRSFDVPVPDSKKPEGD